jgi:hypothetical protein
MRRAAMLAADADRVLADPTATVNDRVRISGAAERAHAAMIKALQQGSRHVKVVNPFDAYAAQKATA